MSKHAVNKRPVDAGLKGVDHYASRLPPWRLRLRNFFIPIVRWETPYLAAFQKHCRSPALDTYFALTATLGTHTFFMIILPILFWCGYVEVGRALVHILAGGVYFTGFFKDLLCLPRPLSPPLIRISKSPSVALEYGFPSTHATNAVSVVVYAVWALRSSENIGLSGFWVESIFYVYALSILVGRLYCGMHGFFDVIMGSLLGAVLAAIQCKYGATFDKWIFDGSVRNVIIVTVVALIAVRVHSEPADDCPCFDDSVAFSAVMIGVQAGTWHFSKTSFAWNEQSPGATPFLLADIGWPRTVARIVLGVLVIFAWRGLMKPTLFKLLPPIFRVVEELGLSLPRRFFLRASQYKTVPRLTKDDNVIPQASDIPALINSFSHPRRRSISVGPQSQADAYEAIAMRDHARRLSSSTTLRPSSFKIAVSADLFIDDSTSTSSDASSSSLGDHTRAVRSNKSATIGRVNGTTTTGGVQNSKSEECMEESEMDVGNNRIFSALQKPRVRYDVEVITKLIVYCGIGWLAVEVNPILFELGGLGMGSSWSI